MKIFKSGTLWGLMLILTIGLAVAYATEIRDDMRFRGPVTIDGVVQEQTDQTDGTSLCFEGTTDNAFETCFLITDPTADRVVTFGDSSFTAGATNAHTELTTITVTDETTNVVADLLTTSHSTTGTVAAGFGTGISFDMEDLGGLEEQGNINMVFNDETDAAEMVDFYIEQNSAGALFETFRIIAANSATTADSFWFNSSTTEADVLEDMIRFSMGAGSVSANSAGIGMVWHMPDGTGNDTEEIAALDVIQTDVTAATNDATMRFKVATAGTPIEVLSLAGASSGTTGDQVKVTANTTETNALLTNAMLLLEVDTTGGEGTTNLGGTITVNLDGAAAGLEEAVSIDFILTDGGDGTENADIVYNQFVAGTVEERVRFDADDNTILLTGTLPKMTIGDNGAEDTYLVFDGVVEEFYMGIDDSDDQFVIGLGEAYDTDEVILIRDFGSDVPVVTLYGEVKPSERYTTEGGANTLTMNECGLVFSDADGTPATTHTLPAIAGSAGCEFMFINASDSADDDTVTSPEGDNIVCMIDVDDASYNVNDADVINFVDTADTVGDYVICVSDGVDWFCRGVGEQTGSITCTG